MRVFVNYMLCRWSSAKSTMTDFHYKSQTFCCNFKIIGFGTIHFIYIYIYIYIYIHIYKLAFGTLLRSICWPSCLCFLVSLYTHLLILSSFRVSSSRSMKIRILNAPTSSQILISFLLICFPNPPPPRPLPPSAFSLQWSIRLLNAHTSTLRQERRLLVPENIPFFAF